MLEYWNYGIMGSGRMDHWSIGKKPFLTGKLINGKVSFNINIPPFHYSRCETRILTSTTPCKFNELQKFRDI